MELVNIGNGDPKIRRIYQKSIIYLLAFLSAATFALLVLVMQYYRPIGESVAQTPDESPLPQPLVMSFAPIADTFVRYEEPNRNYGSMTTVRVEGKPFKTGYLMFDLTDLSGLVVTQATLRFFVESTSKAVHTISEVPDVNWEELTLTYNIRPETGEVLKAFPGGIRGTWVEIDLTDYVALRAGSIISLAIDNGTDDKFVFYSREAQTPPELLVEYEEFDSGSTF